MSVRQGSRGLGVFWIYNQQAFGLEPAGAGEELGSARARRGRLHARADMRRLSFVRPAVPKSRALFYGGSEVACRSRASVSPAPQLHGPLLDMRASSRARALAVVRARACRRAGARARAATASSRTLSDQDACERSARPRKRRVLLRLTRAPLRGSPR